MAFKIRYGTLKTLIRELALSPSVFKNNKPHKDPFDDEEVASALQQMGRSYEHDLIMNLTLASQDKYNAETREFDDATYDKIKQVASASAEEVVAKIHKDVVQSWVTAHKNVKGS